MECVGSKRLRSTLGELKGRVRRLRDPTARDLSIAVEDAEQDFHSSISVTRMRYSLGDVITHSRRCSPLL